MKDQFVTYEIALVLKELGFDEECLYNFEYGNGGLECKLNPSLKTNSICDIGEITAPLWQQALKFLHTKLDFYYPFIRFIIYEDNSGCWYKSPDNGDEEIEFEFGNLEEAVLTAIELCQKQY